MTIDERNSSERLEQSLIDIAVESWRFSRLFARVVNKLDAGEAGRYVNQLRYFQKKLEDTLDETGLKLVNLEGELFEVGMAASALNIVDFEPDDSLLIDQMVEPIIMGPGGLKKEGTVMLRSRHHQQRDLLLRRRVRSFVQEPGAARCNAFCNLHRQARKQVRRRPRLQ
jgi:hypothetical protein